MADARPPEGHPVGEPKRKKAKGCCWHCGSPAHRARECPDAVCRICQGKGHDVGACPKRPVRVDLGSFKQRREPSAVGEASTAKPRFTYAELFAGIGGFRVAFDKLGGRCVFACDIDRFARAAYAANYGDTPAGDVTKIADGDVPAHDVLCGGFPCQPFSASGKRDGFDDPEGRGVLFREICRIARAARPKALLLENVRGLLTHEGGETLATILRELTGCGYRMSYRLLDAAALLPQERARVFLVGVRDDLPAAEAPFAFPTLPGLNRGVRDVLHTAMGDDALGEDELAALTLSDHQIGKVRAQAYTQKHPEARFLEDTALPSKTLQSSYASYMVGSQFVRAGVEERGDAGGDAWRRYSPREAARLMGFPETFSLCRQRPYRLLGNAVAPPVIAALTAPLLPRIGVGVPADFPTAAAWGWAATAALLRDAAPNDGRRAALAAQLAAVERPEAATATSLTDSAA
eukprot:TRINITY_DN27401_c0_g1_i1.p1 TRINITY_DN27401_c0_g1~~TRINITY_DN27401_c0_g1_i1.p1  ORF type:complete len:463 (+),score=98.30 TRINITY_DN27401_c0_g1_i1:84-1472(+)